MHHIETNKLPRILKRPVPIGHPDIFLAFSPLLNPLQLPVMGRAKDVSSSKRREFRIRKM